MKPTARLVLSMMLVSFLAAIATSATTIDPVTACWSRTYGTALDDAFLSMKAYAGGSRSIVTGGTNSDPTKPLATGDALVAVLDADGDVVWAKAYGGPANDWGQAAAPVLENGTLTGFIVAGNTRSYPWDGPRYGVFFAMRLDLQGNVVWAFNYGWGMDSGNVRSVNATITNGALTGFIVGGNAGGNQEDGYIVRLDPDGRVLWARKVDNTVGNGFYDEVWRVNQAPLSGGYVAVGWSQAHLNPLNTVDRSGWILKLDDAGNVTWWKVYGRDVLDEKLFWGHEMNAHGAGNASYIAAGVVRNNHTRNADVWVIHVDGQGNPLWQRWLNGRGDDEARHIHHIDYAESRADLVLSGSTMAGEGGGDGLLVGMDHHGNVKWAKAFGGPEADHLDVVEPFGNSSATGTYHLGLAGRTASFGQLTEGWELKVRGEGNVTPLALSGLAVTPLTMWNETRAPAVPDVWDANATDLGLYDMGYGRFRDLKAEPTFLPRVAELGGAYQATTC